MSFIKENITFLRKANKFTQAKISHQLGIPVTTYASYEYGKAEPDAETLLKICDIFGVENVTIVTSKLFEGKVNKNEKLASFNTKGKLNSKGNGKLYDQKPANYTAAHEPQSTYGYHNRSHQNTADIDDLKDDIIESLKGEVKTLQKALSLAEKTIKLLENKAK